MKTILILALIYIFVMPIIFRMIPFAHKKMVIDKKAQKIKGNNATALKKLPKPLWPIWKERISYIFRDKRDFVLKKKKGSVQNTPPTTKLQNRTIFFLLWLVGLLAVVIGAYLMNFYVLGAGYFTFFIAMIFAITVTKDVIEMRKKMYRKMFEIGQSKLGLSAEFAENPQAVIKVLEWNPNNNLKPQKIKYDIPTTFSEEGSEGFLRLFNQVFGTETTWVPFNDKETGTPGWNFEEGEATFYAVPPLPAMAKWDEHYIVNDAVAWSFFPIGLGVENGLELPNPATGEVENVIGFDVSGEQIKVAKQHGLKVGNEITTSPMCLTGDTLVLTNEGAQRLDGISQKNAVIVKSLNSSGNYVWNRMVGTRITRTNTAIIELTFNNGYKVKCTPDHEWMLSYGTYVMAKDLLNLYVKGYQQEDLKVVHIRDCGFADVYDGMVEKTHNFIVLQDKNSEKGLVTSNCFVGGGTGGGKSLSVDTLIKTLDDQEFL